MTEPLRFGFVGCGTIAQAHAAALRLLADDGDAVLVAAVDPDGAGIERVAAIANIAGDVRRLPDAAALCSAPDVDAIVVITPTRFHEDAIVAAVEAGTPFFTEKPLAPTFAAVRRIHDLITRRGVVHQVGFQSRFSPLYRELHRIVTSGELGRPMGYSVRSDQYWPTGAVVPGHSSWRSDVDQAGGGALLEHSIHSLDVLVWLFGPATTVTARTGHTFGFPVEDSAALLIEHGDLAGTLVTISTGSGAGRRLGSRCSSSMEPWS